MESISNKYETFTGFLYLQGNILSIDMIFITGNSGFNFMIKSVVNTYKLCFKTIFSELNSGNFLINFEVCV